MSRVRFLPVAASEVAEAESWYGDRSPELQRRLRAAVRAASSDIELWPDSHALWPLPAGDQREVRSAPVKGFPYRLFYSVTPKESLINWPFEGVSVSDGRGRVSRGV